MLLTELYSPYGKPIRDNVFLALQFLNALLYQQHVFCQSVYWFELAYLFLRLLNAYLCVHEVLKVFSQFLIFFLGISFLKHIVSDETVQIVEHLYSNDLIEKCKGFIRSHAKH